MVNDGQLPRLRVGGSTYRSGMVEGAILGEQTGIAEDPAASDVRIWRVRKDWVTADLLQDAAEFFNLDASSVSDAQIAEVRAQYGTDWDEWPAAKGAPFYDNNNDGLYDPSIDRPGLAAADQVIWFVTNDLDTSIVRGFVGSPPIGLENQVTIWAYDRDGTLGDIIFRRNRLIYKGNELTPENATIDSMFISQWCDVELGDSGDDWAGYDSLTNTAYFYNNSDIDNKFIEFGLAPPSVGYTLVQGPIVPSLGEEAIKGFSVRSNFKNLHLSSFVVKMIGTSISDPSAFGNYSATLQFYDWMQGLRPDTGGDYLNPLTNQPTLFHLTGDPITGTGWIGGQPYSNSVTRMIMSTGPFSMAIGDTQEVIIALVGGIGGGRFESIVEMKKAARLAISLGQNMFSEIPEANLNINHPSDSEAMLKLTVDAHGTATEVIVEIYNYDNVLQETLTLLDDGNSGEGVANDSIWGVEWLTDQRVFGMYANALIVSGTDTTRWEHILDNITTLGPVEWDELIIVSDNINEDGIINSGEKVVFNPSINNGSFLSILGDVTIGTFLFDEYVIAQNAPQKTEVESIQSGITQLGDTFSRYFVLADDTPDGHLLKLRFSIVDKNHNVWVSELEVRVSEISFSTEIRSAEHAVGTATGTNRLSDSGSFRANKRNLRSDI
ncbi:MAG: hypothetical protein IIB39_08535 [Candidatus Marinimicrobia bacterium]|nr:hypothetical protein [Candidatus Neomarinimicrobiota bacterium]